MKEIIDVKNANVIIKNNKIYINGVEYIPKNKNIKEVEFKGDIRNLDSDCSFTINGNVKGDLDIGGSVCIEGNVTGDIDCGGSITINGWHKGDIDAGGNICINN